MAKYNISCPKCGGTLEVQEDWSGMETECPLCRNAFVIPPRNNPPVQPVARAVTPPAKSTYSVSCPKCGGTIDVQEEWGGMEADCPLCRSTFVIPPRQQPAAPCRRATLSSPRPAVSQETQVSRDETQNADAEPCLYNPVAAEWLSLLLTPVFGSWCVWRNYKALGDSVREKRALRHFYIYLIADLALVFIGGAANIVLLIVWYYHVGQPHCRYIKENAIVYRKQSWLMPILISIAIMICYVCYAYFAAMAVPR